MPHSSGRRGQIVDAISIRERPAEAQDRAQEHVHRYPGRAPYAVCNTDQGVRQGQRECIEAWVIRLRPVDGEAEWTLWVSAADGKPLELRDPGRDGQAAQVIRWSTYEVLPGSAANQAQLSLTAAHPDAQVVHDPAQVDAARNQLWPPKG